MNEQKPSTEKTEDKATNEQDFNHSLSHQKYCQLFWDYYGPSARGTAEHFLRHLHSWLKEQAYTDYQELKVLSFSDHHSAASCVLPFDIGKIVFRSLKAQRACHYELED